VRQPPSPSRRLAPVAPVAPVALALLALLALPLAPSTASGYSFYTARESGEPLRWFQPSTHFHISSALPEGAIWEDLPDLVQRAFDAWIGAPGCATPEVTFAGMSDEPSATSPTDLCAEGDNIIAVVDDPATWSGLGHSRTFIAVTLIGHDTVTGEIVDADMLINAGGYEFFAGETPVAGKVDLLATLTHEAGHFFGLDHSEDPNATMFATYTQGGDPTAARILADDDIDGICALYADAPGPEASRCAPAPPREDNGGCQAGQPLGVPLAAVLLLLALSLARRPRRLAARR